MDKKRWLLAAAILAASAAQGGCIIAAAAAGGYIAADEATENDGEFDPFEDVIEDITDNEDGQDG